MNELHKFSMMQERTVELAKANDELKKEIKGHKQSEAIVKKMLQQNHHLTRWLFNTQEVELQLIGKALHDEFEQTLVGIELNAHAILTQPNGVTPPIKSAIEVIIKNSRQIQERIHLRVRCLRPVLLDELGLLDSLLELVRDWQERQPDIEWSLDSQGKLDDLGEFVDIMVYRIVQECLTNVARHANAGHVMVKLYRLRQERPSREMVLLSVEDNGKGMDPMVAGNGVGILVMRERVLAVGGSFAMIKTAGGGLHVEVRIPVDLETNHSPASAAQIC